MSKVNLKETFEIESKHEAFYTGGSVQWSENGEYLFCQKNDTISIVSLNNDSIISSLGKVDDKEIEEDAINCFTLIDDDNIISHHKSGLFKLWDWKANKVMKLWKAIHKGPVAKITHLKTLMASGGCDSSVRLWNLQYQACTHNLKGVQGVINTLEFHPESKKKLIFGAGDDPKIHGWDIVTGQEKVTLSGHMSKVTSLNFHENGNYLVSSGRDQVLILWDISSGTSIRVLPVFEEIEGAFIISVDNLPKFINLYKNDDIYVASAGEEGKVKIWEMKTGRKIYEQNNSLISPAKEKGSLSITHLFYNSICKTFAIVSVEHNIIIHSLESFECKKQLMGFNDEILDIAYVGDNDSHIALATNSCDIKFYDIATMNCQLLCGHTDSVLALATTPANVNLLISAAKDHSIRVWLFDKETAKISCIARAVRHTAPIGSVAMSQSSTKFLATVSQDSCLKVMELSDKLESHDQNLSLDMIHMQVAHGKEINCVTISPNDKFIATSSQDKTAKLWSADNLQLLGVFRGHRRGVWCVRFSPVDQVVITTSADCTIKLWSMTELNCLKTYEGHESSVLRGEFLSHGMQLITSGGDGLLKLWNIKTSECMSTLAQHESHVWTLAITKDEQHIISGGSDSLFVIWKDVTEEKKAQITLEKEKLAFEEQKLTNLLKADELQAALRFALKLERPLQVLRIIEAILKKDNDDFIEIIKKLKPIRKEALLKCAITWNTNSRNSHAAQMVINALITDIGTQELQVSNLSSILEAMIPYTDRHFKRLTKLLQDLHLLTYTINRMKPDITSIK